MGISLLIGTLLLGASIHGTPAPRGADSLRCSPGERRIVVADVGASARAADRALKAGERLGYAVYFGMLRVGSGEMRLSTDTIEGRAVWQSRLSVDGGFFMLSVHDTNMSWFDTTTLNSRRFVQRLHEPRYHASRDTRIWPERHAYQQLGDTVKTSVAFPLDDVSFVYFVRTLPLEPGQCYEIHRYFLPEANPVIVHVVAREQITVPAGTFKAIVLRPEIITGGIFSKSGRAELWLSDDSTRIMLQLKSQLAFGSINLYLRSVSGGWFGGRGGGTP